VVRRCAVLMEIHGGGAAAPSGRAAAPHGARSLVDDFSGWADATSTDVPPASYVLDGALPLPHAPGVVLVADEVAEEFVDNILVGESVGTQEKWADFDLPQPPGAVLVAEEVLDAPDTTAPDDALVLPQPPGVVLGAEESVDGALPLPQAPGAVLVAEGFVDAILVTYGFESFRAEAAALRGLFPFLDCRPVVDSSVGPGVQLVEVHGLEIILDSGSLFVVATRSRRRRRVKWRRFWRARVAGHATTTADAAELDHPSMDAAITSSADDCATALGCSDVTPKVRWADIDGDDQSRVDGDADHHVVASSNGIDGDDQSRVDGDADHHVVASSNGDADSGPPPVCSNCLFPGGYAFAHTKTSCQCARARPAAHRAITKELNRLGHISTAMRDRGQMEAVAAMDERARAVTRAWNRLHVCPKDFFHLNIDCVCPGGPRSAPSHRKACAPT
jgi:hypothetical protein